MVDAFVAKKLVAVALVNTDDEPFNVANVPVVLLSVVTVAEAEVRLETVLVDEVNIAIVPEAEIRFSIVAFVMVVVAIVEVPNTTLRPEVVAFPSVSTLKLRFSSHSEPLQVSIEDVAVPLLAKTPVSVSQNVEVPLVERICHGVPVAPVESVNLPTRERFTTEAVLRFEIPDTVKLVVEALIEVNVVIVPEAVVRSVTVVVAKVVRPVEVKDDVAVIPPPTIVPLVNDVNNAVTPFKNVEKKLDDVALVVEALIAVSVFV